jgi:flagellar hook-length control protein FliK
VSASALAGAGAAAPTTASSTPASATTGPVSLGNAAEAVEATITMAAKTGGVTQARIELSPDSLGDIQIHLQHTADGIVARVITAHPEAAQTLRAGSDDLKRSLEQNGTTLLRLDISTSGRGDRNSGAEQNGSSSTGAVAGEDEESTTGPTSTERVADLTGSALVNVLA